MECPQRVSRVQWLKQLHLALRRNLAGPGNELCVQYFAFAKLVIQSHAWMGEHVAQALKPAVKGARWQLEKEVGMSLAGSGIDLAAVALHVSHQVVCRREALGAQKQQVFQEMREAGPGCGHIVAARGNP